MDFHPDQIRWLAILGRLPTKDHVIRLKSGYNFQSLDLPTELIWGSNVCKKESNVEWFGFFMRVSIPKTGGGSAD